MQLKINNCKDIIPEWIPHDQLDEIKEIDKNSLFTLHSAKWKNGPLYWVYRKRVLYGWLKMYCTVDFFFCMYWYTVALLA